MEFRRSDLDEPPAPLPPPPPPPFWLQQPPPPPQPQSSYCDYTEQPTTRVGCRNSGFGLDNDYLNNVEYIGQGIGRATENFQILHNVHKEIQRDLENETRKSCINPGFGIGRNVEYLGQGTGRANRNVDMLYDVDPETQRDIEKEKIREEIIAAEMLRRRELEAEVREELRIERVLALRMKGGNAFDKVRVSMEKSLKQEAEEKLAMYAKERLRIQGRTEANGMDMFSFPRTSLESKRRALVPAKKDAYTVFGVWGVGNREGKKDWRCFICQVSATSEVDLKHHLNGKKHKSKRDALKAEKAVLLPTAPPIVAAKPLDGNAASMLPEKNKAKGSEKFAFWCDMCNAGANNKYAMDAHKKGKKHLNQLQKKFAFWCDNCKFGARQANVMEAHLRGKKHSSLLQEKSASTTAE